jgi:hypothetical protein
MTRLAMRDFHSSQPSLLSSGRRECLCDLRKNGDGISFWNYPNGTDSAKVIGIFSARIPSKSKQADRYLAG